MCSVSTHQVLATWLPLLEDALGPERILELRLRVGGAILVDPGQLQGAIAHLLTNARDATPPGSIVVAELSRVERAAGPACRIAVTDRGEGMTPEVMRQAVEPFSPGRPGHGLGLGLTIARMVAESHGGFLEVDSRVGTGTTVSISLPIAESDALSQRGRASRTQPASAAPASAPPVAAGSPAFVPGVPSPEPAPKPARIMVVDDEEAIAEYLRIILSAEQYDVTVVASLQRAIETFTRDHLKFDTVLLDMMLGDGTGLDLYRRVREMRPDMPVVVYARFRRKRRPRADSGGRPRGAPPSPAPGRGPPRREPRPPPPPPGLPCSFRDVFARLGQDSGGCLGSGPAGQGVECRATRSRTRRFSPCISTSFQASSC